MLATIVRASLRHRLAVLAAAAILTLAGVLALRDIDIDVLPDISRPTLTVMTEAPGLAPEEVERLVTQPVELALTGLPASVRVRSTSAVGLSIVTVELDWGADVVADRQQAAERLAIARSRLPPDVLPQIQPVSSIMGEVMLVALTADRHTSPMDLRGLADWVVRPRLAGIPGVSQVLAIGGEIKEYRIAPRPALMAGLDISAAEIEGAVSQFGVNRGGGYVDQGGSEYVIRTLGSSDRLRALGDTMVAVRDGTPVLLRQVAHVTVASKPMRGSAGVDGENAVILSVQKQPNADTRVVTRAVVAALGTLQRSIPAGVHVDHVLFKQADFIDVALGNVGRALAESVVVVAAVLFLFLGNLRTTLISLVAIPLSLLFAVLVFRALHLSVNTMTLGGLAIAMGELVDDAVVGVENVFRRLKENRASPQPKPVLAVVASASEEVRSGILYATAIIVLVLLPLFAISGLQGLLFTPLALAYLVALLGSLAASLTVTPVLCALLLPRMRVLDRPDAPLVRVLKRGLARLLPWAFRHTPAVYGTAAAGVAVAALLLAILPRSVMPPFNEGSLTVALSAMPGISLAESSRLGAVAERLLLDVPGVAHVGRRTGRAELDEHAQGVEASEIDVILKPSARSRAEIVRDIRRRLAVLPVAVNIGQPISHRIEHMLSGIRAQVVVKLFGADLDTLGALAARTRTALAPVPGLVDLQVERQARIPTIEVDADDRAAALYGTNSNAVTAAVSSLANGRTVSQVIDGAARTDVSLRLADRDRTTAALSHLLIEAPAGRVPADLVSHVVEGDGPNRIEREDGRRRIAVFANAEGGDMAGTIAGVRSALAHIALPSGYSASLEGEFLGEEQAARRVAALGLLSLIAIFLLLFGRYRSPALALIVMVNVPLALIGGVIALAGAGLPLSLASVVGFVTLAGISLRNGILKVSHYLNLALLEGESFGDALILRGSLERLTPVLMTAAAAGFALLPLLANPGAPGKEILYPVAAVVFGGLVTATLLDTVLTPLLFRHFGARPLARLAASRRVDEEIKAM